MYGGYKPTVSFDFLLPAHLPPGKKSSTCRKAESSTKPPLFGMVDKILGFERLAVSVRSGCEPCQRFLPFTFRSAISTVDSGRERYQGKTNVENETLCPSRRKTVIADDASYKTWRKSS